MKAPNYDISREGLTKLKQTPLCLLEISPLDFWDGLVSYFMDRTRYAPFDIGALRSSHPLAPTVTCVLKRLHEVKILAQLSRSMLSATCSV